jgi:hypothetical protein
MRKTYHNRRLRHRPRHPDGHCDRPEQPSKACLAGANRPSDRRRLRHDGTHSPRRPRAKRPCGVGKSGSWPKACPVCSATRPARRAFHRWDARSSRVWSPPAFPVAEARRLVARFEWHYNPTHGSWLDMAEPEISVVSRHCLDRRIPNNQALIEEVAAWQASRNKHSSRLTGSSPPLTPVLNLGGCTRQYE